MKCIDECKKRKRGKPTIGLKIALWHAKSTFCGIYTWPFCLIVTQFHIFQPNVCTNCRYDFACKMIQVPPENNRNRTEKKSTRISKHITIICSMQTRFYDTNDLQSQSRIRLPGLSAIGNCSIGLNRKHWFGYIYTPAYRELCIHSTVGSSARMFSPCELLYESGSINWDKHFYLFNWNADEKPVHSAAFTFVLPDFHLVRAILLSRALLRLAWPLFFQINTKYRYSRVHLIWTALNAQMGINTRIIHTLSNASILILNICEV